MQHRAEGQPHRATGTAAGGQAAASSPPEPPATAEPNLDDVLEKAAELQQIIPNAVLVGGAAAAFHARHRTSTDHDHVVADLDHSFDTVLGNLEALGDFSLARAQSPKIILGELGGIETGVRQMFRTRPLETTEVTVRGKSLTVPTAVETLRIKAWLLVSRNQTRDYVDVAVLADHLGMDVAAGALARIDEYYDEVNRQPEPVATQLVRQLADPRPRDIGVTEQLRHYKGLDPRWHDWTTVTDVLGDLVERMVSP